METNLTMTDALLAAGTVAAFFCVAIWFLRHVVVWARRRRKRAYVIGAALAPLMALGMVVDPDMRIIQEAKRLKKREEDNPGDPPSSEDEEIVRAATEIAAEKKGNVVHKGESGTVTPKPTRPALIYVISTALGLVATTTTLVLAWLLFADAALLDPATRFARDSLSVLDWGTVLGMSALLLISTVMLFRLRKSSMYWFGAYLAVGVLGSVWYALTPGLERHFDVRVTSFGGIPIGIAVLLYMFWLKKRAVLA
jgi:hypothetical protein